VAGASARGDRRQGDGEAFIVYFRGEVESREQLKDLIERARAVDGVASAESLLHLPGEPAPHRV
jgi:osmotically-inducible protein OsmY